MSKSRIGKNTAFLYLRTLFIMLVSLFTARIVLNKFGISDYGIYNTIASVVMSLSFLNASLGLSASRFITYCIGENNYDKLKDTFSNIVFLYFIISILILIILELIGPWFIHNKIVYDINRTYAVNTVFQLSIFTVIASILSTPFTSLIIAHEDMNIYAYIGIFEAISRLIIAYLISITKGDRLINYAFLLLIFQIILFFFNYIYCKYKYEETNLKMLIDAKTLKPISLFSGWSIISSISSMLQLQGINIITNIFFGPAVVAGRAISVQVNNAINSFVNNFRTAVNPQIVKRVACGDIDSSKELIMKSTVYTFILTYIICFPLIINSTFILHLWLKKIPDYTVSFVQLILIQSILMAFEHSFYSVFYSYGRIKENSLINPIISIIMFFIVYLLFNNGYNPLYLSYCYICSTALSCIIIKPILICQFFNYQKKDFIYIFKPCVKLLIITLPLYFIHDLNIYRINTLLSFLIEFTSHIFVITIISLLFIIDKKSQKTIFTYCTNIIKNKVI